MSDPNDSGAVDQPGGAQDDPSGATDDPKNQANKTDPSEQYKADMLKWKDKYRATQGELEKLRNEKAEADKKRMTDSENWKGAWEKTENELKAEKEKNQRLLANVQYSEKYRAVLPKLREMGLRADAERLLEKESLDEIELEATSNGRFIPSGVDQYAEAFKKNYAFAFEEKRVGDVTSIRGSKGVGESITVHDVIAAENEFKKGKMPEKQFHDIYNRYQEQRRRG